MFRELEGDAAVLVSRGVFRSVSLYARGEELYAGLGGGYVRLYKDGSTSKDGLKLVALHTERGLGSDKFGRLTLSFGGGHRVLTTDEVLRLTGAADD